MAYTISVDFDVYKALFSLRESEAMTENDVIRKLLRLPPSPARQALVGEQTAGKTGSVAADDWIAKNVRIPAGTEFRASYKGKVYLAHVQAGALQLNGNAYDSPSAAAMAITHTPVNGWIFWECRLPGSVGWIRIDSLRKRQSG